jgi:hypothetical protein
MLSAGEILAVDDRRLRVALWPGSRTSQNLAREGRTLFCYVVPGAVLYVKGRSRALGRTDQTKLERFEITVESVESDMHKGMPVTQSIAFRPEAMDPKDLARAWERQVASLREP